MVNISSKVCYYFSPNRSAFPRFIPLSSYLRDAYRDENSLARVYCRLAGHVHGNSRRIACHRVDLLLACGQSGILSCGRNDGIEP